MARRDPFSAVDAFLEAVGKAPGMQPYFVEAIAECESSRANLYGDEELDRSFCYAERACFASVGGYGVAGPWRTRVERELLRAGYSLSLSDDSTFSYTRHGLTPAMHARELEYLEQMGERGQGLPLRPRKPAEPTFRNVVDGYAEVVERVRASSFSPSQWRCAARLDAAVVTADRRTIRLASAPLHDGWCEGTSVDVQVYAGDRTALPNGLRAAVKNELVAQGYRRLRFKQPHPRSHVMFVRRKMASPGAAVREAARVLQQLTAVCAKW